MIMILEIRNRPPLHRGSCHGEQPHRAKTRPPHRLGGAHKLGAPHPLRHAPHPLAGITSRALREGPRLGAVGVGG